MEIIPFIDPAISSDSLFGREKFLWRSEGVTREQVRKESGGEGEQVVRSGGRERRSRAEVGSGGRERRLGAGGRERRLGAGGWERESGSGGKVTRCGRVGSARKVAGDYA